MALSKQDILDAVGNMSVLELSQLIKDMEEKFGVSATVAQAPLQNVQMPPGDGPQVEQTEFTITLIAAGENKVNTIKAIREVTSLGLKEAKELVDAAPKVIKEAANKADVEAIKAKLEEVGAKIEIK